MTMGKTSPLAPVDGFPSLPVIDGVLFATANAGVKYTDRDDVMLALLSPGTTVAGVFTRSNTRSDAVLDCQSKIHKVYSSGAAILVNSGNANAFTGSCGKASVDALTASVADVLDIAPGQVLTASTGVIGEPLAHQQIINKLQNLRAGLSATGIEKAAQAIMTTDTYPKGSHTECLIDGKMVKIAGIAKGSGMIAPDMATMLSFVFTDAVISQPVLQKFLSKIADVSFNNITVDSDTSTSDTLLIAATGTSDITKITDSESANGKAFETALKTVLLDLAHQVVRDGEGATKFVEVQVSGAKDSSDARKAAFSVANSPLVKTAIAGEDPNWGRIVMAIGKSGASANRDKLSIWLGDNLVASNGWQSPDYSEKLCSEYMKNTDLVIHIDLGVGSSSSVIWTCDLTHGYISINADYRS